jgi:glycosyltransferase involved in cell wall biosynthesis
VAMNSGISGSAPPPLVSVVTIFKDGERFLSEAIESIVAQTYPRWELLLVDDGSAPPATAIARDYAAREPDRIRYLDHEGHANRGMSASRNLGLAHARGDYVAFLDADDVLVPGTLAHHVAILEAHPEVGTVVGTTENWRSWDHSRDPVRPDSITSHGIAAERVIAGHRLLTLLLRDRAYIQANFAVLSRRQVLQAIGGFEDAFRDLYEDQIFFAKACLASPIYLTSRCAGRYRHHPESACAVADVEQKRAARLRYLLWLGEYLIQTEQTSRRLWSAWAAAVVLVNSRPGALLRHVSNIGWWGRKVLNYARELAIARERHREAPSHRSGNSSI